MAHLIRARGTGPIAGLPPRLRDWNYCERALLHRGGDPERVLPDTSDVESRYLPESNQVFRVPAYWLKSRHVVCVRAEPLGRSLTENLFRSHSKEPEVLFLVHPSAYSRYKPFLRARQARSAHPPYWGAPTSSTRTLLVWREGREESAFFAKLSLASEIGGAIRTLSQEYVSRSVGITAILDGSKETLPASFGYLREAVGLVPKGLENSGLIIRTVPEDVILGRISLVPMFALYAWRPSRRPLLLRLSAAAGLTPSDYIRDRLCRPFARQWLDLTIDHGFIPEPHAQNLLLETDSAGRTTGRFVHRDFECFYVDLSYRAAAGQFIPQDLPRVASLQMTYPRVFRRRRLANSIHRYFQGSVLFNIDQMLSTWADADVLRGPRPRAGESERTFAREMASALYQKTGERLPLSNNWPSTLARLVLKLRNEVTREKHLRLRHRGTIGTTQ